MPFGPPIPGAPWSGGPATSSLGGFVIPASPTNPLAGQVNAPYLRRDPDADPRTRGFTEKTVNLINSLIAQRYITQTGPASFSLVAKPAPFVETRDPTVFDDGTKGAYVGAFWINGSRLFICLSTATGAALWKGPL